MTYLPPLAAAPAMAGNRNWGDLVAELDRWAAAGLVAALWWRDDDAVTATPALDRLLTALGGIPLGLAVIPGGAEPSLAERLASEPGVSVLHHGWRHTNHSDDGKKSEYPASRDPNKVAAELARGRDRLLSFFGKRALPIFVPPWNRIADEILPLLCAAGFSGVSRMAKPARPPLPPGLAALDVHIDLIDWQRGGSFIGAQIVPGGLIAHLQAQRIDSAAASIPIGIMSHHLVTDEAGFGFAAQLAAQITAHPGARWFDPRDGVGP